MNDKHKCILKGTLLLEYKRCEKGFGQGEYSCASADSLRLAVLWYTNRPVSCLVSTVERGK